TAIAARLVGLAADRPLGERARLGSRGGDARFTLGGLRACLHSPPAPDADGQGGRPRTGALSGRMAARICNALRTWHYDLLSEHGPQSALPAVPGGVEA